MGIMSSAINFVWTSKFLAKYFDLAILAGILSRNISSGLVIDVVVILEFL